MRLVCVLLVCSVSVLTVARADTEHDRIRAERSAANARLAEQEQECARRFFVATCVENARIENRLTSTRLRQHELQLDEGRRRTSAEVRRKAIVDKAEAQQARASEAETQPPRAHVHRVAPPAAPAPATRASDAVARTAPAPSAARASDAQRSEQQYDVRARALRAHQESVERRNAKRAVESKVAAPLPVPEGGSAPR